jgi:eukaryotic-like serine/threonine-protein kinase
MGRGTAETVAATELTGGTALGEDGRYRLQRMLGTGGMASVWLAEDGRLGRQVAIKLLADSLALDPAYVSRFEREARVAARLAHPNLVNVFDFSAEPPRPYLAMEYVPGTTLAELLHDRAQARWDPETIFRQLISALAHVHAAGIVHRDIKPSNVLVGRDGRARLTDFGIARPSDGERLTNTGLVIGTARYIAPEVMRGQTPDERSDLYSCGILLRDCLAGGGSSRLHQVADRLAAEEPRARPASAREALELLDRPLTAPTSALASTSVFRTGMRVPRSALFATAVVFVVLIVVLLTGGGGTHRTSPTVSRPPSAGAPLTQQLSYLDRAISQARR